MKNIIVVTGASSGMGKEFVTQYIKENKVDEVWAIANDETALNNLKAEIGDIIVPISIDLSLKEEIEKYNIKLEKEKPNVLLLANIAGFGKFDHSENIPLDVKLNMIDVNVKAPVALIDYTLPYMQKGSKILNVSSCAAFQPIPYINNYAATKSFILLYSRALRRELKYRGIHVMVVTPYWTKTNFFNRAIDRKDVVIKFDVMYKPENVVKQMIKDLKKNKEISIHGKLNKLQMFLVKILPHSFVMNVWMKKQKYNGTPNIR